MFRNQNKLFIFFERHNAKEWFAYMRVFWIYGSKLGPEIQLKFKLITQIE